MGPERIEEEDKQRGTGGLTREMAESISRECLSNLGRKEADLELENERLKLRIQMQENRAQIVKDVHARNYSHFLEQLGQGSGHFCYCGGKALDVLRADVKKRFLEGLSTKGAESQVESLFSTNEDFHLNRRFWQLKEQFLGNKIKELKVKSGGFPKLSLGGNLQTQNHENIDKGLLKLVSLSGNNLGEDARASQTNGNESLDKDALIAKLREDLKNIISISEQRKINRSILQTQFLKSGVFRKIAEMNQAHVAYIAELEQKLQKLGQAVLEIEWRRRRELDELVFREREGENE